MKEIFYGIISFILISIIIVYTSFISSDDVEKYRYKMINNIGKTHIINQDTLTIVNFNIWDDTYIMSNGLKVHKSLIEK